MMAPYIKRGIAYACCHVLPGRVRGARKHVNQLGVTEGNEPTVAKVAEKAVEVQCIGVRITVEVFNNYNLYYMHVL